jgi:hypothetical protein
MLGKAHEVLGASTAFGVATGLFLSLDERVNEGMAFATGLGMGSALLLILGSLALLKKA